MSSPPFSFCIYYSTFSFLFSLQADPKDEGLRTMCASTEEVDMRYWLKKKKKKQTKGKEKETLPACTFKGNSWH